MHLQLTDWPYVRLLLVLLHSREDFLRSVSDGLCFLVKEVLMDSRHRSRSVSMCFIGKINDRSDRPITQGLIPIHMCSLHSDIRATFFFSSATEIISESWIGAKNPQIFFTSF